MSISKTEKLGPLSTWMLAAGGMVGGGIYVALGVVIGASGQWAWLSFLIAGLFALCSAVSYAALTTHFNSQGGAFDFFEEEKHKHRGGTLAWLLIIGYILTISVYAYAFGNYIAYAFQFNEMITRLLSLSVISALITLNLLGVSKIKVVEIVIVTLNLLILLALAFTGLLNWDGAQLSAGIEAKPISHALIGAAVIFMSYEGFQLLTYDYDDMEKPQKWFLPILTSATVIVILIYIAVCLGATMISGAGEITSGKSVALSIVAQEKAGIAGLIALTLAAAFATSAAINSTLYSTAKLTQKVANENELPNWFGHTNANGMPDRTIILIGALAATFSMFGSLSSLVEAASLIFLITFGFVNIIGFKELKALKKIVAAIGVILCIPILITLIYELWSQNLYAFIGLLIFSFFIIGIRRFSKGT